MAPCCVMHYAEPVQGFGHGMNHSRSFISMRRKQQNFVFRPLSLLRGSCLHDFYSLRLASGLHIPFLDCILMCKTLRKVFWIQNEPFWFLQSHCAVSCQHSSSFSASAFLSTWFLFFTLGHLDRHIAFLDQIFIFWVLPNFALYILNLTWVKKVATGIMTQVQINPPLSQKLIMSRPKHC